MTPLDRFGLVFLALVIWVIVSNIECMFLHMRYGGNLKRGVRVWSEPLPEDMKRFLRYLPGDVIDDKTGAFIRKENNVVLVQYLHTKKWWRKKGAFPYVAYIDLRVREPRIQYRVPITSPPFIVLWMAGAVWASFQDIAALFFVAFGAVLVYVVHTSQRKEMLRFVNDKMKAFRA